MCIIGLTPRRLPERAVNFVRRDLDESLHTVFAGRFREHFRADDIRVNEVPWIRDAAIDMRLGGKIHDRVELVLA